ncbi:MAG: aminotransferase class V-fold PLP-dependent enzyme [Planctomycetota bacterium]
MTASRVAATSEHAAHWQLEEGIEFLNHGSFGACPTKILEAQDRWRKRIELEPVRFFVHELEPALDETRRELGSFLGASPDCLAFVPNATYGVNSILRSLELGPQDELLVSNHEYNASRNALDFVAARTGARVQVVEIPFPLKSADEVVERVLGAVNARTRLLLIDHVTSQTGLVLPIEPIVQELNRRGIDTLIDGAHAPGMVPLELDRLGATYYTGNCHKWLCTPKGSALLYVREDRQARIRPLAISHGANSPRSDRSKYLIEFDWTGTIDPTPWLVIPESIRFLGSLLPGGFEALRKHNRDLALAARPIVADALGIELPCPDTMIGHLASFPLPPGKDEAPKSSLYVDPLQDDLMSRWGIEIPIMPWPAPPKRIIRFSAQLYNSLEQYKRLAGALKELL